jgi:hypothetical protein
MKRIVALLAFTSIVIFSSGCIGRSAQQVRANDLEGASDVLRYNIAAIHRRDVDAYLAQYLNSPEFVVTGADSLRRGYLLFAEARRASDEWPDTLIAGEPEFVWIAPGVVWGGFEYAAVTGIDTVRGWSQRVLVKTVGGWKIAVTGVAQR